MPWPALSATSANNVAVPAPVPGVPITDFCIPVLPKTLLVDVPCPFAVASCALPLLVDLPKLPLPPGLGNTFESSPCSTPLGINPKCSYIRFRCSSQFIVTFSSRKASKSLSARLRPSAIMDRVDCCSSCRTNFPLSGSKSKDFGTAVEVDVWTLNELRSRRAVPGEIPEAASK